jgi:hypothetical protein
MLRTFSDNPTCKHIVFGGCHDAGYLLNLDQYKHNPIRAARITLLESTPAYRGFTDLPNFQRARFDNVFKNTPLPDFYQQYSQAPMQAPVQAPVQTPVQPLAQPPLQSPVQTHVQAFVQPTASATFQPLARTMTNGSPAPVRVNATPVTTSPSTTTSSLAYPNNESPSESSWATVGKTGVSPNENISIAPKTNPKKKWAYYNKEGQRLDEALPPRDTAAAQSIDQRMRKAGKNLCNHWHLNKGKCHNKDTCKFQHEPKLSPAEIVALRYKTRSLACKDRYCENIDCCKCSPYNVLGCSVLMEFTDLGHQCTFERDQGACPYPDTCNLSSTHGMDKQKFSRWDEQGNEQTLG